MKNSNKYWECFFVILILLYVPIKAQWSQDSTDNLKISSRYGGVDMVSDGYGGAIVFITGGSAETRYDIYAKKINHDGYLQWGGEEVEICRVPLDQWLTAYVSDGSGGAIVGWRDFRRSVVPHQLIDSVDVYVQYVNSEGEVLWGENGMDLRTPYFGRRNMWIGEMVEDGQGGAIVQFSLEEGFYGEWENYVQRIDSDGNLLWGEDAVAVDTTSTFHHRYFAGMVTDTQGGVIVGQIGGYTSSENFYYFIRINHNGEKMWTSDTMRFSGYTYQDNMASDGMGGVYYFYQSNLDTSIDAYDIYIQLVGEDGTFLWGDVGTCVTNENFAEHHIFPMIKNTSDNQAVVVWHTVEGKYPDTDIGIYAQKINYDGEPMWDAGGVVVVDTSNDQSTESIVAALDGGVFVVWKDTRDYDSSGVDIYAQRLNAEGDAEWPPNGLGVSIKQYGSQMSPYIVSDGSDGVIISWYEINTETGSGTYVQQVNGAGQLGVPGPLSVEDDVPIPFEFYVSSFPNPFNSMTTILYDLPHPDKVSSAIYNIEGKEVIKLFEGEKEKGNYRLLWNATDERGVSVASGIYLFRVSGVNLTATHKMLLLR